MPLISTTWTSGCVGDDAAASGAGAACCARAGLDAPVISRVAANAKGFNLKDVAASEGGYGRSGVSARPLRWGEFSWPWYPMRQRAEQPRRVRDPLLGP